MRYLPAKYFEKAWTSVQHGAIPFDRQRANMIEEAYAGELQRFAVRAHLGNLWKLEFSGRQHSV